MSEGNSGSSDAYPAAAAYDPHPQASPVPASASGQQQHSSVVIQPIQYQSSAPGSILTPGSNLPLPVPQNYIAVNPNNPNVQAQILPYGAVPMNGGVLYTSNLFSDSYCVPGPGGEDYIYYSNSMPMPPVHHYPSGLEQWHSQTKLLKVFIVCLLVFWGIQFLVHWRAALFLPILFIPSYLLYREWQKNYQSVELYMMLKLYATAFAPGALVVIIVESILTIIFMFMCFQSFLSNMFDQAKNGSDTDPTKANNNNSGMEFLNFPETPSLFIFLFLLSYVSAGCVEESLKYYCANSIKQHRPSYKVVQGYLLYALSAALGFSTIENIGYVLGGAYGNSGDSTFLGIFFNCLGRTFISTPLHCLTGYLIGLQVVRRDILGESLNIVRVMGWSIFFHGTFDFGLFVIMALQSHWSNGSDDNTVSFVLMACVIINVYAGLIYRIWRVRQKVFRRVEQAEGIPNNVAANHDLEAGSGHVAQSGGDIQNGFSRLQNDPAHA